MMMMAASVPTPTSPASTSVPPVPWSRIDRFVGQLTHDVRNGLNALELQLTLLGEIAANAEVTAEVKALRGTLLEVTRQLQAVKTNVGPVVPQLLCYPAADFFEDLRERFQRLQPKAAERVSWEIVVDGASLAIDPELSLQALLELLANALYFGGPGTPIGFLAEAQPGGGVKVTLREAQPQRPAVATQDWGRTPLLTTRRSAYGLGLFRVRQIIEAQGGVLHAEYSEADHVLTTSVTLPATGQA
jgi:K+-sensing histidine kinase KdpD